MPDDGPLREGCYKLYGFQQPFERVFPRQPKWPTVRNLAHWPLLANVMRQNRHQELVLLV